jgi:hypothetical protein
MRTRLLGTAVAAAALVATTSTAYAVTFGSPDGDDHPAVGALVADQAFSEAPGPTARAP